LFFALFFAFRGRLSERVSPLVLTLSILLVNIPILFLMGTGWMQFGPRYTLDFTVPLIFLTALGMKRWPGWLTAAAIFISIVSYTIGALVSFPGWD
jgi:hypothetical protein